MSIKNKKKGNSCAKLKAMIFDFDDTLVSTKEISLKRHREAAKRAGLEFNEKEFLEKYGGPWPDILYSLFGGHANKLLENFYRMGPFNGKEIDGARETLTKLHSKNILLGILSSGPKDTLLSRLRKELGCEGLFDRNMIIGKDDLKKHKPHKTTFSNILLYLKSKNIGPAEIIYCGDLLIDFEAARNASINFIAVTTGKHTKEDFIKAGVDRGMITHSIKGLPERLEQLGLL